MTLSFRVGDRTVSASVPFRMGGPYQFPSQAESITRNAGALSAAAASAFGSRGAEVLGRVEAGRGAPGEISALAGALVRAGAASRAPYTGDAGLRRMLFDHGIGVDCAGYVRQAAQAAGLLGASASPPILNDDLSDLPSRGFEAISNMAGVRPGDIFVLGPPAGAPGEPGHRAIVYDQHRASVDEENAVAASVQGGATAFPRGATLVLQVDSSWGCGGQAEVGGVRRETWWYSEGSKSWAWRQGGPAPGRIEIASQPYGHALIGVYRKVAQP